MPCYLRKICIYFLFFNIRVQTWENLDVGNKMWGMGKGTYLVVENSGNSETYGVAAS